MKQKLWDLVENADWYGWPPKRFWGWMLRRMDRHHGHHFEYDK